MVLQNRFIGMFIFQCAPNWYHSLVPLIVSIYLFIFNPSLTSKISQRNCKDREFGELVNVILNI